MLIAKQDVTIRNVKVINAAGEKIDVNAISTGGRYENFIVHIRNNKGNSSAAWHATNFLIDSCDVTNFTRAYLPIPPGSSTSSYKGYCSAITINCANIYSTYSGTITNCTVGFDDYPAGVPAQQFAVTEFAFNGTGGSGVKYLTNWAYNASRSLNNDSPPHNQFLYLSGNHFYVAKGAGTMGASGGIGLNLLNSRSALIENNYFYMRGFNSHPIIVYGQEYYTNSLTEKYQETTGLIFRNNNIEKDASYYPTSTPVAPYDFHSTGYDVREIDYLSSDSQTYRNPSQIAIVGNTINSSFTYWTPRSLFYSTGAACFKYTPNCPANSCNTGTDTANLTSCAYASSPDTTGVRFGSLGAGGWVPEQASDSGNSYSAPLRMAIFGGREFSLILRGDGTVYGAGKNVIKQLAASLPSYNSPIQIAGSVQGISLSAGAGHSLALRSDSTVIGWGDNGLGQIGSGLGSPVASPTVVPSFSSSALGVVAVAAGGNHSVALTRDGNVYTWGRNSSGQLGNGGYVDSSIPTIISHPNISGRIIAIAAGYEFTLALRQDRTVWSWGNNVSGQLGNFSNLNSSTPVQVLVTGSPATYLQSVTAIAAGDAHGVALTAEGKVVCWGNNTLGQLGDNTWATRNTASTWVSTNSPLGVFTNVRSIAAGPNHCLALTSDREVYAWGWNNTYQLGDGSTVNKNLATKVISKNSWPQTRIADVISISAGTYQSLALLADGSVKGWGLNSGNVSGVSGSGQLGGGSTPYYQTPTVITGW